MADDLVGHLGEQAVVGKGVGAEAEQGFANTLIPNWTATMPDAWCATGRQFAPSSSTGARAPGGVWACMATMDWAATSASTSTSAY